MRGSQGGSPRGREIAPPKRREIAARLREGARVKDLAEEFCCSTVTVWRIGAQAQLRRRRVSHSRLRLCFEERERISRGIAAGESARAIDRPRPGPHALDRQP